MIENPEERFTAITSSLLGLIEALLELIQHKPEHSEYWSGYVDSLCVILSDIVEMEPNLQRPELVAEVREWLHLAQIDKLERELIEDQGFDC